jgi:hypothetical protein
MANPPELFDEPRDRDSEERRPAALTPQLEMLRGEGYRWASLDVTDLDPPTPTPP